MKKVSVRVVKKDNLKINQNDSSMNSKNISSKSIAHKISNNVMNWVDELRERKTGEMLQSFDLLSKVIR